MSGDLCKYESHCVCSGFFNAEEVKIGRIMESPCIGMCTLNEKDMCLGCGRMLNEITSWTSFSEQRRTEIVNECEQRVLGLETLSPHLAQARKNQINNG